MSAKIGGVRILADPSAPRGTIYCYSPEFAKEFVRGELLSIVIGLLRCAGMKEGDEGAEDQP